MWLVPGIEESGLVRGSFVVAVVLIRWLDEEGAREAPVGRVLVVCSLPEKREEAS